MTAGLGWRSIAVGTSIEIEVRFRGKELFAPLIPGLQKAQPWFLGRNTFGVENLDVEKCLVEN